VTSRDAPAPAPFPAGVFITIAVLWVLLDVPVVLAISGMGGFQGSLREEILIVIRPIWLSFLAAKVMLMLGWWFLGEGMLRYRLAGLGLFAHVFCDAVRLLKQRQEELDSLRSQIGASAEQLDRGEGRPFNADRIRAEVAGRLAAPTPR
jgi:hypothetical protein